MNIIKKKQIYELLKSEHALPVLDGFLRQNESVIDVFEESFVIDNSSGSE